MTKTNYKMLADFAPYVAAQNRLDELESERDAAVERVVEWQQKLRSSVDILTQEAGKLVEGGAPTITLVSAQAELKKAKEQLEILDKAVELQTKIIAKQLADAQREMQADRKAGHKICIRKISHAMSGLQTALEEEAEFASQLQTDGKFLVAALPGIKLPFELADCQARPFGNFLVWRRRFIECGYLES